MAILYRLYQNNNRKNTKAYGKWYAHATYTGHYDIEALADEVQRNCSMKRSDVKAVIEELVEVIQRELGNSHTVTLGNLGTFRMGVRSTGTVTVREYNANKNITGVRVNFTPLRKKDSSTQKYYSPLTQGMVIREAPKNTVLPEPQEDEDGGDGE